MELKQYQIVKDGKIYFQSDEKGCGYPPDTLREMEAAGYFLFSQGKQITRRRKASAEGEEGRKK